MSVRFRRAAVLAGTVVLSISGLQTVSTEAAAAVPCGAQC